MPTFLWFKHQGSPFSKDTAVFSWLYVLWQACVQPLACQVSSPRPMTPFCVQTHFFFLCGACPAGGCRFAVRARKGPTVCAVLLRCRKQHLADLDSTVCLGTALTCTGNGPLPASALPLPKPQPHSAHRAVNRRDCGHVQCLPNGLEGRSGHPVPLGNRPRCFTISSWEAVTFELTLAAPAQGGQTN